MKRALVDYLSNPDNRVIIHNGMFDSIQLERAWKFTWRAQIEDTMLLFRLIYPELEARLSNVASLLTWEPFWKMDSKLASATGDLQLALSYGAKDASVTFECYLRLMERAGPFLPSYRSTLALYSKLRESTHRGFCIDPGVRNDLDKAAQGKLDELEAQLDELTQAKLACLRAPQEAVLKVYQENLAALKEKDGKLWKYPIENRRAGSKLVTQAKKALAGAPAKLNANSPIHVAWWFYRVLRVPPYKKDGKETVGANALRRLATRFPEARLIEEIRHLSKLRSNYLQNPLDPDGRWRACWKPAGTTTGRLSSEATYWETGGPLQNLAAHVRPMFRSDKGKKIVSIDLQGAEWWIATFLSRDAKRLAAYTRGLDPHLLTAELLFGPNEPYALEDKRVKEANAEGNQEEIKAIRATLRMNPRNPPASWSCRQAAKKANHALDRMEGIDGFALVNYLPRAEAKRIYDAYLEAYPGIKEWWAETAYRIKHSHSLTALSGRRWNILQAYSGSLLRDGLAFLLQAPVADAVSKAILTLPEGFDFLIHEHDKLVFQVPVGTPALLLLPIIEAMTPSYGPEGFRLKVDVSIGDSLGSLAKAKNEDELGRLLN